MNPKTKDMKEKSKLITYVMIGITLLLYDEKNMS
jgi:hypothetical protein